ncbi:FecR domain-containing protein [Azoarcus olearius]|nr:FecR domain-containing protein [Azoarcus olearius]
MLLHRLRHHACLLLLALFPVAALAQAGARLTYLEGQAQVIRDVRLLAAAPGLALAEADIVETAPGAYALLEFPDGLRLALGGDSRLLLRTLTPRGKDTREFALLQGWAKAQSGASSAAAETRLLLPTLTLQWREASFIINAAAASALFVEGGSLRLANEGRGRGAAPLELRGGRFVAQAADRTLSEAERPAPAFVAALPRPFRDPLPALLARFGDRQVEARVLGEVDYAAVAPWLKAPPPWRTGFVSRFTPRTRDAAFRQHLADNLKAHPEWERVLYPERFQPRPPPPR